MLLSISFSAAPALAAGPLVILVLTNKMREKAIPTCGSLSCGNTRVCVPWPYPIPTALQKKKKKKTKNERSFRCERGSFSNQIRPAWFVKIGPLGRKRRRRRRKKSRRGIGTRRSFLSFSFDFLSIDNNSNNNKKEKERKLPTRPIGIPKWPCHANFKKWKCLETPWSSVEGRSVWWLC